MSMGNLRCRYGEPVTAMREAYLTAARSAASLLAEPAVAASWPAPSALAEFTVSGLAGHLAYQVLGVGSVLDAAAPDAAPIRLLDHYARAAWIGAPPDADVNVRQRVRGEQIAADGPGALAAQVSAAVESLTRALRAQPDARVVDLPWTGWALRLDDFLVTRMMEIAVHSDDLAVSVNLPTPDLPDDVMVPVLTLLAQLAARRHGQPAMLRALTRAERSPASIVAF